MPVNNRITYFNQGLFVGQTPNTGDSFIDKSGNPILGPIVSVPNNYISSGIEAFNTIQQINCVQSISYSFDIGRRPVLELGNNGLVANQIIQHPTVNLDIETLQNGVNNELKLGLTANFTSFISGRNGVGFYAANPNILSGFYTRWTGGLNSQLVYPRQYSDKKNFYLKIEDEGTELISATQEEQFNSTTLALGSCYLSSYIASARVGDLPRARYTYICENANIFTGSMGLNPALDPYSGSGINTGHYIIPTFIRKESPKVISPNDIRISLINNGGANFNLSGVGFDWNNFKVQAYQIELSIGREPLESLTCKVPFFRSIVYPIFANINIEAIVSEDFATTLNSVFFHDNNYDLTINLKNRCTYSGLDAYLNDLIQYNFNTAKLRSVQYGASIGQNVSMQLSFVQEVDPTNPQSLMSISGFAYGRNNVSYNTTNNLYLSGIDFMHLSGSNVYIRADI